MSIPTSSLGATPSYIGEVVPPRFRGGFVSFNQLAMTSGILVSYLGQHGRLRRADALTC